MDETKKFDWDDPIVDQAIILSIVGVGVVVLAGMIIATTGGSTLKKLISVVLK